MSPFFIYTQGRPHIILSSTSFYQKNIVRQNRRKNIYFFGLLFHLYSFIQPLPNFSGLSHEIRFIFSRSWAISNHRCPIMRRHPIMAISNHHCPIMRRRPILGNFQSSLPRVYTLGWGVSHLRCWEGMVFIPPRCIFQQPLFSSFSNLHTILWISNNLHADDNISS